MVCRHTGLDSKRRTVPKGVFDPKGKLVDVSIIPVHDKYPLIGYRISTYQIDGKLVSETYEIMSSEWIVQKGKLEHE